MKLGPFLLWPQLASGEAAAVDMVSLAVLAVCSAFALGILLAMLCLLLAYRQGRQIDRSRPPLNHHALEISWIALPTLLGLALFWLGARHYERLYELPESTDLTVDVVGKQWLWVMHYPNGFKEINRLHVPLGKRVTLRMVSQDVIHSLFLPDFRIKHDVLPGRYTYLWFQPTRTGLFHLLCAEFCGTSHAAMGGWLEVMSPEAYQQWQSGPDSELPEQRGQRLFQQFGCQGCHQGFGQPAPRLENVLGSLVHLESGASVLADEDYLRRSILDPGAQVVAGFQPIMPIYRDRLNEEQVLDLLAYIRAMRHAP
ncbi:MAG: cytochrome c oxidase subunit II [Vulcanimicrobiota bacterium]